MSRTIVALLLLHHIEGQCKPFTAATLAARAALGGLVQHIAGRDTAAAVERARVRQAGRQQRAVERQNRRGAIEDGYRAARTRRALHAPVERVTTWEMQIEKDNGR